MVVREATRVTRRATSLMEDAGSNETIATIAITIVIALPIQAVQRDMFLCLIRRTIVTPARRVTTAAEGSDLVSNSNSSGGSWAMQLRFRRDAALLPKGWPGFLNPGAQGTRGF